MEKFSERVRFASAPVSWGVQDDPGPAWEQPYEHILDEIRSAGYTGTELGPYGFFPTDHAVLSESLRRRGMSMLSSFVPVPLADPSKKEAVLSHVRKVGALLYALDAKLLVLSDAQTPQRRSIAGRAPVDGCASLSSEQWKAVGLLVAEIERAASEFGLGLVFHPHVATYVETPLEVERLFDSLSHTQVGLCLDTGHCVYGGSDPAEEAKKYRSLLRYIHIKDINARVLGEARRRNFDFEQAIGAGIFSPIGEGCIDFAGLFRFLSANGYSGWMVVEQDVIYGKTAVPPAESMRASLDYLKKVLFELESAQQSTGRTV
ncbi:MAG TPA: TIM barrel protein [Terriglobales bacterium]|nr:TIM barrel protein [Terriglobales bacterium]